MQSHVSSSDFIFHTSANGCPLVLYENKFKANYSHMKKFKVEGKGCCKGLCAQQEGQFPFACFGNLLSTVTDSPLPFIIKPLAIKRLLKSPKLKSLLEIKTK